VTSASGGLGALYAAGLAERGYDLVLVGREQETLNAVAAAVKQKSKVKVETLVADLITALTRLTHAVLPGFVARGAGSIINVASVLAFHPWPEFGPYGGSKAYVVSFSQALPARRGR